MGKSEGIGGLVGMGLGIAIMVVAFGGVTCRERQTTTETQHPNGTIEKNETHEWEGLKVNGSQPQELLSRSKSRGK